MKKMFNFILYQKGIISFEILGMTWNWQEINDWTCKYGELYFYPLKIVYRKIVEELSSFTFEDAMAFVEGDTVTA